MKANYLLDHLRRRRLALKLAEILACGSLCALCLSAHAQKSAAKSAVITAMVGEPGAQQGQGASSSAERTPVPPLGIGDQVGALHVQGLYPHEALADIARKANVAIGFEADIRRTDGKVAFDFPGGTVADLLNAFVAHAPDFRWQADGGIIHVHRNGVHVSSY
jgi:hypothetical protein